MVSKSDTIKYLPLGSDSRLKLYCRYTLSEDHLNITVALVVVRTTSTMAVGPWATTLDHATPRSAVVMSYTTPSHKSAVEAVLSGDTDQAVVG